MLFLSLTVPPDSTFPISILDLSRKVWAKELPDKITHGELLKERPEISWIDVMGIRNHIAHGYFDIDGDIIFNTVKKDLVDLQKAIEYFLVTL